MVILKEPVLGWWNNYKGRLKSSWTGSSVPLLHCYASLCITFVDCCKSTDFSNSHRKMNSKTISVAHTDLAWFTHVKMMITG